MALSAKFVRGQIERLKPITSNCSIQACRIGQNKLGEIMSLPLQPNLQYDEISFDNFRACWITPKKDQNGGVILYLHGGGYVAGDLEYTKGYGSVLAAHTGVKTFCIEYRLAPEFKFPAPVDDALVAYRFLLRSGYSGEQIILAGESAGGGLVFCLAHKLKELGLPMPAGIVALSPWTDLTFSGKSFKENRENDPSLSEDLLRYYAKLYTDEPENELVSPIFGDLSGMPDSLIFVGGDEILLDDSRMLYNRLIESGSKSELVIAPEMWHVYMLYNLSERKDDQKKVDEFILEKIKNHPPKGPKWMKLDNAAKIYPAAMSRSWTNIFRISVTLKDDIDPEILQSALEVTVRRFPSIAVGLKSGMFWFYLQQVEHAPAVKPDTPCPTAKMTRKDLDKCAFRVFYYRSRIAVEFFHSLTDGTGAMIFVKTLAAEYIEQRYGITVSATDGVLDRDEKPKAEELEDSFLKYSSDISADRKDPAAYHLGGEKDKDGFRTVTTFIIDTDKALAKSKEYGVTLTVLMTALLTQTIIQMQDRKVKNKKKQRPVKILVPVNLRKVYGSNTLRNFAYFSIPGVDPRLGEYTFEEILRSVQLQLNFDVNDKILSTKFSSNVKSEKTLILRVMPLFIKNLVMKMVYNFVGERTSCLNLSNLGAVTVPPEMEEYVTRFDFVLGVEATRPYNVGMLSYKDKLYLNFIRDTKEPELEYLFYENLRQTGLEAEVESNSRK